MQSLNYLVVQSRNGRPTVRVVSEGTIILDRFEAWPIDTGKRVMAVNGRLLRELEKFRIGGSVFAAGAQYAGISYDEIVLVCKQLLGETEREKYERIVARCAEAKRLASRTRWRVISDAGFRLLGLALYALARTFRLIMVLLLVPVVLHWIGKRKGSH